MAISTVLVNTAMEFKYKLGVNSKGEDINKEQTYNLKINATDAELGSFVTNIGGLFAYPITQVLKKSDNLFSM